jgi:hypothetical protein
LKVVLDVIFVSSVNDTDAQYVILIILWISKTLSTMPERYSIPLSSTAVRRTDDGSGQKHIVQTSYGKSRVM